jgi:hypothetical protein
MKIRINKIDGMNEGRNEVEKIGVEIMEKYEIKLLLI